jgi:transcriptional regulator with XRE-family HTH domain
VADSVTLSEVDFASLVRQLRQLRRLTQEQLARELEVTFGTVNGWENGRHEPIAALGRRLVELAEGAGMKSLPLRQPHPPSVLPRSAGRRRIARSR